MHHIRSSSRSKNYHHFEKVMNVNSVLIYIYTTTIAAYENICVFIGDIVKTIANTIVVCWLPYNKKKCATSARC